MCMRKEDIMQFRGPRCLRGHKKTAPVNKTLATPDIMHELEKKYIALLAKCTEIHPK